MTKTIDFTQTADFQDIFAKMQIQADRPVDFAYQPYKFTDDVWNNPLWSGIVFTPQEFYKTKQESKMNCLFYQGQRVIAYWSNQVLDKRHPRELTELAYTYHLTWCKNLDYLRRRFPQRKVLTVTCNVRPEQTIEIYDCTGHLQEKERRTFQPCPHCLEQLNWKGYQQASIEERLKLAWNFSLKEYLR